MTETLKRVLNVTRIYKTACGVVVVAGLISEDNLKNRSAATVFVATENQVDYYFGSSGQELLEKLDRKEVATSDDVDEYCKNFGITEDTQVLRKTYIDFINA